MSLGFFHNRLDWINQALAKELAKTTAVEVIDINDYGLSTHNRAAYPHNLYVNRVYPSEAAASYNNMRFMLEVTRYIESLDIPVVNPFSATYADFSRTEALSLLHSHHLPVAACTLFSNQRAALAAGKTMHFPKIIKMDCGGKARKVYKVDNVKEYEAAVQALDHDHHLIHVEEMLVAPGFTTRVIALDYKVVHISKRTLAEGWLGNASREGSDAIAYQHPPHHLYTLGKKAAWALRAPIVAFDIVEATDESYIVDVNTTPVFTPQSSSLLGFRPEEALAEVILRMHTEQK